MVCVTTTGDAAPDSEAARARLDRPVLVSNLLSGALWLSPLTLLSWPLFLIGAVYVVAGSVFLGAVYAREDLTRPQEALAWTAPWLAAVLLWMVIAAGFSFANPASYYPAFLGFGLVIGTPSYLAWQVVALAVRQFMTWRAGGSSLPT